MNDNIDRIIYQVLTNQADEREMESLNRWLDKSAENRQTYEVIKNGWKKRIKEPTLINEEEMFDKVWEKGTSATHSVSRGFTFYYKIAASFLILVSIGYLIISFSRQYEQVVVEENKQIVIKENPAGQKSKLFLPDGTIAWLNAESSIQYLEAFTDSSRNVTLIGEAYFEVASDSLRPFIVQSGNIFTEALGTAFNINSFYENENIEINLISGKVRVSSTKTKEEIILNPGEAISIDRDNQNSTKYLFDVLKAAAWKDGILAFENATFDQTTEKLGRWYGVEINVFGPAPKDWQFSGRFDNENLMRVLEVMQYSRDFEFQLKNKTLNIRFNKTIKI